MKTKSSMFTIRGITALILLFTASSINHLHSKDNPYYFGTTVHGDLEEVTTKVKETLKKHGFGVITEVDMHEKLNNALNTEVKPYRLLGVCDPSSAYDALKAEENVGLMLPCKMIIREVDKNTYSVVSVDPDVMMQMIGNQELNKIGANVSKRLKKVIDELN